MGTESIKGTREELWEIFEKWLIGNEGRETTDQSFGLDYGLELLDAWFIAHDSEIRTATLEDTQSTGTDTVAPFPDLTDELREAHERR